MRRRCCALHPDLVLAGPFGAQTTVALLREYGLRVVTVGMPEDFPAIRAETRRIAAVLGVPARGEALIARMDAVLAGVHGPAKKVRALLWEPRGYTAGPGSLGDAVLRAAGFADAGTGGRIGLEALVAHPPDLLVVPRAAGFSLARDRAARPSGAPLHPAPDGRSGGADLRRAADRGGGGGAGAMRVARPRRDRAVRAVAAGGGGGVRRAGRADPVADPPAARRARGAGRRRARALGRRAAGRVAQSAGRSRPARDCRLRRARGGGGVLLGAGAAFRAGPAACRAGGRGDGMRGAARFRRPGAVRAVAHPGRRRAVGARGGFSRPRADAGAQSRSRWRRSPSG